MHSFEPGQFQTNRKRKHRDSKQKPSTNTVVFKLSNPQNWKSAQVISERISHLYESLPRKPYFVSYEFQDERPFFSNLPNNIERQSIKKIIFIESKRQIFKIIEEIELLFPFANEYIFHVYGNFSYATPEWLALFERLRHRNLRIMTFSAAQKRQLASFLTEENIQILSPPIRPVLDSVNRKLVRKKWKLSNSEFVICYSGRISLMKNVNSMISLVHEYSIQNKNAVNIKILLAGEIDNIAGNTFDLLPNEFHILWLSWFNSLPESLKKRIVFLGNLNEIQLKEVHTASDLYVNLSTFFDEDFGVSPLEALQEGTPAILTNWGGFKQYKQYSKDVHLLKVGSKNNRFYISKENFFKSLNYFINQSTKTRTQNRKHRRMHFRNLFSIETLQSKIVPIVESDPIGPVLPTKQLRRHARLILRWRNKNQTPYKSLDVNDTMFWKTYGSYLD